MACLLLLWLIKTLNRGGRERVRKRETKGGRERELCLFPFRIHLQERNYGWLVCSGGRADRYGGRKEKKKKSEAFENSDAVLFINGVQHIDAAFPLNPSPSSTCLWLTLFVRQMADHTWQWESWPLLYIWLCVCVRLFHLCLPFLHTNGSPWSCAEDSFTNIQSRKWLLLIAASE